MGTAETTGPEAPGDVRRSIPVNLGIDNVDRDRLEAAIEFTRFDRMRDLEDRHGFPERSSKAERFFRRGTVDGWRDELDPTLAGQIADTHHEQMQYFGYV